MATFHEKIEMCYEVWGDSVLGVKEIHGISGCRKILCHIGTFVENLFSSGYFRRRSPRFLRNVFIKHCEMFADAFDEIFIACKNKNIVFEFLKQNNNNESTEQGDSCNY